MRVHRKRFQKGTRFYSVIRVDLDEQEMRAVVRADLSSFKIQRHAGTITGNSLTAITIANAFQAQVSRLRDRWSVALSRTTGFVFIDIVILYLRLIRDLLVFVLKIFFGTRQTFRSLINGTKYSAKRVEDLKEIETFVFVSIAAVHQALKYAIDMERDDIFVDNDYRNEIVGLTFAGAVATADFSPGVDGNSAASDLVENLDLENVDVADVTDFVFDSAGGT